MRDFIYDVAESLSAGEGGKLRRKKTPEPLLSRGEIIACAELFRQALFPGYFGGEECLPAHTGFNITLALEKARRILKEQIRRAFCFSCAGQKDCSACAPQADRIARAFLSRLPAVQKLLLSDVNAAYEGDPAATSPAETVLCYPGVYAISSQRLAHELYKLKVPLIPRIITEHAHSETGIDIHPGAKIGARFFIDHGTGVVVGETSVIGKNVKLYQGVTLGAKSFPLDERGNPIKGIKRHPRVEDDVTVYAGATILGPVTIGKGSVIGGNVWLTRSVPPFSKITQQPAK